MGKDAQHRRSLPRPLPSATSPRFAAGRSPDLQGVNFTNVCTPSHDESQWLLVQTDLPTVAGAVSALCA